MHRRLTFRRTSDLFIDQKTSSYKYRMMHAAECPPVLLAWTHSRLPFLQKNTRVCRQQHLFMEEMDDPRFYLHTTSALPDEQQTSVPLNLPTSNLHRSTYCTLMLVNMGNDGLSDVAGRNVVPQDVLGLPGWNVMVQTLSRFPGPRPAPALHSIMFLVLISSQ